MIKATYLISIWTQRPAVESKLRTCKTRSSLSHLFQVVACLLSSASVLFTSLTSIGQLKKLSMCLKGSKDSRSSNQRMVSIWHSRLPRPLRFQESKALNLARWSRARFSTKRKNLGVTLSSTLSRSHSTSLGLMQASLAALAKPRCISWRGICNLTRRRLLSTSDSSARLKFPFCLTLELVRRTQYSMESSIETISLRSATPESQLTWLRWRVQTLYPCKMVRT